MKKKVEEYTKSVNPRIIILRLSNKDSEMEHQIEKSDEYNKIKSLNADDPYSDIRDISYSDMENDQSSKINENDVASKVKDGYSNELLREHLNEERLRNLKPSIADDNSVEEITRKVLEDQEEDISDKVKKFSEMKNKEQSSHDEYRESLEKIIHREKTFSTSSCYKRK